MNYNTHHSFFDGSWTTGIWVGLRVLALPGLMLAAVLLFAGPEQNRSPSDLVDGRVEKSLEQILEDLGGTSSNPWSTPASTGAKFIRP